jgi:hypothetical protein
MSKFFIQMLLSVMVGVSAALGLSTDAKSELRESLREAKAYLHERANVVIENAHELTEKIDVAISTKTSAQASSDSTEKLDVKVNNSLSVKSDNGGSFLNSWIPGFSVDGLLSGKTQTDIKTDGSNLDVGLKEKTTSTLDLGFGN